MESDEERAAPGLAGAVRVGVFGGTFDPPHVGHLIVAQDIVEALGLDVLVWMPAREPPHKDRQSVSPADARLELTRAAVGGDERFEVSEVEMEREGPSYTVDTLRRLRQALPRAVLHLVVGADQFQAFGSWREPEEIGRLATVAVMDREGADLTPAGSRASPVPHAVVPVTRIDISSTDVRARVRSERSIRYLVPAAVRRIIEEKRLYTRGS
jgi:nicotinate-nucleotide adenylyltransferase